MTAAHQNKVQAKCVACQKLMGEKPPVKNDRRQMIIEATEATKRAHQKGQFIFLVLFLHLLRFKQRLLIE